MIVIDYMFICFVNEERNSFVDLVYTASKTCMANNKETVFKLCDNLSSEYIIFSQFNTSVNASAKLTNIGDYSSNSLC